MLDVCLCASRECPIRDKCYRAYAYDNAKGINTVSLFAEVCNEQNGYKELIKRADCE